MKTVYNLATHNLL